MNRPAARTLLLGHPLVALPTVLVCLGLLYACWRGGSAGIFPAVIPGAMLIATVRANETASAYKRWKREWDAMAGTPSKRYIHAGMAIGFALIGVAVAVAANGQNATNLALGWIGLVLVAFLAFALLRALFRRLGRRTVRAAPAKPAAVVATPLLTVPSLKAAYAALPEHCQRLLAPPVR